MNITELESKIKKVEELEKQLESEKSKMLLSQGKAFGTTSNSIEQKALTILGKGSLHKLLRTNIGDDRFKNVSGDIKSLALELKRDIFISRSLAQMFYNDNKDGDLVDREEYAKVNNILNTKYAKEVDLKNRLKAFGSTVSGAGDEWVPTLVSEDYIHEYELSKEIAGKFKEIPMASNPFELPVQINSTKARKASEGSAMTGANFGTSKLTFNAIKSAEYYELPEELNEDSAPAILNLAKEEVLKAQIRALEAAIISGDTTATHMDADFAALGADIAEKFWIGLRKRAIVNIANCGEDFGSAITTPKLDAIRKKMKKFGVNVKELCWVVSPNGYSQLLGLDEVTTVDKFGPMATILTGALASFRGIPIVISEYMRDDLNASGVNDGVTVDNSSVLLVNFTRFFIGVRRPVKVKILQDQNIAYDRWLLASYGRFAFTGFAQSATELSVGIGYNITI